MGDCPTLLRSEVPAVLWGLFPFLTRCFGTAHLGPDTPRAKSLSCHVTGLEPFLRASRSPMTNHHVTQAVALIMWHRVACPGELPKVITHPGRLVITATPGLT